MTVLRIFAAGVLFLGSGGCVAGLQDQDARPAPRVSEEAQAIERGRIFVAQACASCHATGQAGASPMPEATPFREIVHRYPLNHLEEGFAEGLVTAHPAMPEFVFRASEIDDLIAYLETVRAGR